jgi:hypothetical protein
MKLVRHVLIALAAGCMFAAVASAQDFIGKFTLPCEVQWGTAVLPAGNYTLEHNSARRSDLVTIRGEKETVMALPASQSFDADRSGKSALILARMKGKAVVRVLVLRELGMEFYYPWPKGERVVLAEGPVLIQRISITTPGR